MQRFILYCYAVIWVFMLTQKFSLSRCFFFLHFYLFMIVTEREREAETQAEGEAASMHQKPDVGFNPGSPGSHPGPKAGAKPLRHPGIPWADVSSMLPNATLSNLPESPRFQFTDCSVIDSTCTYLFVLFLIVIALLCTHVAISHMKSFFKE